MTGKAIRRCAVELSIGMAGCAGGILMLACQRKSRGIVIEIDVSPTTGDMAGATIRTELPFVDIPG